VFKTAVYGWASKDFMKDELPDKLNSLGAKQIISVQYTSSREILVVYEVE